MLAFLDTFSTPCSQFGLFNHASKLFRPKINLCLFYSLRLSGNARACLLVGTPLNVSLYDLRRVTLDELKE